MEVFILNMDETNKLIYNNFIFRYCDCKNKYVLSKCYFYNTNINSNKKSSLMKNILINRYGYVF